ncbi:MAG: glycosyltransferase [Verrucomicrobiota bacterium]
MHRCDLQVQSLYSDRPSEWILRKLGVPESYTSPEKIYRDLKEQDFQWVTITDHNRLEGCLEIAHHTDVFLSEKVTTYFPNDHCKIHLLVWNLNESQHKEISDLRNNIFELSAYLRQEKLVHGVCYPLTSINGLLMPEHIEKLLLLFRIFDGTNFSTSRVQQDVFRAIIDQLDQRKLEELANKHDLDPAHDRPWEKVLFGGSDDHASLYIGKAWTEVDQSGSVSDFLEQLESGKGRVGGDATDVACFSAALYKIIFSYAADQISKTAPNGAKLLERIAERFLAGENPAQLTFSERLGHLGEAIRTGKALDLLKPNDLSLNRELTVYFLDPKVKAEIDEVIQSETTAERRSFRVASKVANDLIYRLFHQILGQIQQQNYLETLQPASGMLPVVGSVSPYIFSYFNLYGSRHLWRQTAKRFGGEAPDVLANNKRAWFTDTLEDVNGVARTIRTMAKAALHAEEDLTVVTSRADCRINDIKIKNFEPVGEFELPEYKLQKLSFPPILDMIDYIEQQKFTECIISTPGPVGLTALAAAKLMGLRTSGIYHTDFPQYVRILTEDEVMETMMWNFMHWFYSQLDLVYVNSQFYKDCWIARGIPEEKLKILPRGLDTELFNHTKRKEDFWKNRGANHPVLLYVGRVSKEKELEFLADVMETLWSNGAQLDLAIVGEGPYSEEMGRRLPRAIFTGVLNGEDLAQAYASADLFVFPSTTDTFGNVVIEAMSSGLPAFVSNIGGPCELVNSGQNGLILPAKDRGAWTQAIETWADERWSDERCETNAKAVQARWSWNNAFRAFWDEGKLL